MAAENYRWSASPSAKDEHLRARGHHLQCIWFPGAGILTYLTDDSVHEFRVDTYHNLFHGGCTQYKGPGPDFTS